MFQNPSREEEIQPLKIPEGDDFGKDIKLPASEETFYYIKIFLKRESLRKHPYSYKGHWRKLKDGILPLELI